jgi:hypothetical protein
MQFTSPDSGWIVLQKQASQAFNAAILLKTSDGGQTWQKIDLPFAGPVHFTSATQGWVENHTGEIFYQTADGGLTWQPAEPNMFLGAQSSLPEGTILSGWQESGLAWAISSAGACRGEKNAPDFSCTVEHALLQSLDGGHRWQVIPLPQVDFSQP